MRGVDPPGTHEPGFVEEPIREISVPRAVKELNPLSVGLKCFVMGECTIMRARERPAWAEEARWHLSIGRRDRHPSWDEMKVARYRLLPDEICMAILMPPSELWVNVPSHDHVFHLHEIRDPNEVWRTG